MTTALIESGPGALETRSRGADAVSHRPDIRRPTVWGMAILLVFVGGFGTWAALAPLSSAAVAPGTVAVDTKRKTVQHLEGGIVSRILVREGERVVPGQPLVRLDTTQALATRNLHRGQLLAERALDARLVAERDGLEGIAFPPDLLGMARGDAGIRAILDGQRGIFAARRVALQGQLQILTERIGQLGSQIKGLRAQERAALDQLDLIRDEIASVRALIEKGLERLPRLRSLQRQVADLSGRLGSYRGDIAKAQQAIGETRLEMIDLRNRRAEEVVGELRDVREKIADLEEQMRAAEDVLQRQDIVAPVGGSVVNLKTVTPGGVVAPGDALMEIVPEEDKLTIQAQIRPTDIDTVHPGLPAKVRLTAFKAWVTPMLDGELAYVSADSLSDSETGAPYYDARIEVDRREVGRLDQGHLYPGMPVQAMVVTGELPLLAYFVQPLLDSFSRAFREA
jgi:HlyD family secretion protein